MSKRIVGCILIFFVIGCTDKVGVGSGDDDLRIISLSPEVTEILFSLGLNDEIVGVTTYCNFPEEAKKKERIGPFSTPNIEKIVSLRPTVIFATGLEQSLLVEKLRNLKLKVYVSYPSTINELFDSIEQIARLTSTQEKARALIEEMNQEIDQIKNRVEALVNSYDRRPRVFVQIWHNPLITIGKNSLIDEMINLAGGINITSDINRPYSYVDLELIVKRNPDCIILAYMADKDEYNFKELIGFRKMNAVRNNRIYDDINPDLILRASPRITEGLEELFIRIHNLEQG